MSRPNTTGSTTTAGTRESPMDTGVERLGRWTARHTTRRSFLHRLGQLAMVIAAGPSIGTLLMRSADARVCGQSGITPKCDTFDCVGPGDVWGWCWYASDGCCRNGGLKKICDCCTIDYPNVHGYCPSGTNVRCIVESCGNDPRLQSVALTAIVWQGGTGYYRTAIERAIDTAGTADVTRPVVGGTRAVLVPSRHPWLQYVGAPLAGAIGGRLWVIGDGGVTVTDRALLEGWGIDEALVIGPVAGTGVLTSAGIDVDQVYTGTSGPAASIAVAERIRTVNDINRTVTVATVGLSARSAPVAASFATLGGFPLMVGVGAAASVGMPTLFVALDPTGTPAAQLANDRTAASDLLSLSRELGALAAALPMVDSGRVALAPQGSSDIVGLTNLRVPVLLHPPDRLGHLEQWLQDYSLKWGELQRVFLVNGPGMLTTSEFWKLQGAVNGYRVDQLRGVAGEGLPVIRQPMAERPVGKARTDGAFDWGSHSPPPYWTNVGQTLRK